ncbi:hypothetical protein NQ315_015967 [Exocentrus adspersus]|uniref:Angiotensin-converting enzyme n=1 Tax=Exocentrus adspersus TaxID=1586481 RepID=A0AAV8VJ72_9CUCU|nr:hypothetical protein NQ315_015967 [Exocentrus adspersus]
MIMVPYIEVWCFLLVVCNCFVSGSFSSEKLLAELQLADLDLADACDALSNGLKSGILKGDFKEKIEADNDYGTLLRAWSENFKTYEDIPTDVQKNYTYFIKPGDGLLPEKDWNTLASYHNSNEEVISVAKVPCANNSEGCLFTKTEYQSIMKTSKDVDFLKATWISWQHVFGTNAEKYISVLELVKKAATLNVIQDLVVLSQIAREILLRVGPNNNVVNPEFVVKQQIANLFPLVALMTFENEDVVSYWEYLNDFSGAYSQAKEFWEEIKPLYFKLHGFVRTRLNNYYKINETAEIPVYLLDRYLEVLFIILISLKTHNFFPIEATLYILPLPIYHNGNNFGNDWSHIANVILPHPQLHYDVETFLKYKNLPDIYKLAQNLTQSVSLGGLGDRFWSNSKFNMSYCRPYIFSYCSEDYSEVYDCNIPSWTTYLNAHETAFKIALRNQDYLSLMRLNLRYSGVDEAIATLGPLLAIESIHYHGVKTVGDVKDESIKMTKLLLTALKFLPQLAYYLAADEWRLSELDHPSENVATSWWKLRGEYQGVKGATGAERDFVREGYITSNKPYISKFFGIILAFQFVQYYRSQMADPDGNIAFEFGNDPNFLSMVRDRSTTDWPYLVTLNYGFDISASHLLEYFKPLEQYLVEAPLEQVPVITTTTTTTTTTKSTTTTTTPVSITKSKDVARERISLNISQSATGVQSDQPKVNNTISSPNGGETDKSNVSMYVGVGLLVLVCCTLVGVFSYRHLRRRRRRTNNRRFES